MTAAPLTHQQTPPLPLFGLTHPRRALPLAVVFGVMQTQAFAPTGWWWMQLLALTGLVVLLRAARSTRMAALTGAAFGLGWFLSGIWWLYISMHIYGGMPAWMATLAVLLFSAYLSIYPALAGALWYRLTRHAPDARWSPLLFAALWLLSEWLRGVVFTGFPWLASGYPHTNGPLSGYAPLVGMYGIAGVAALLAALLATVAARATWQRSASVVWRVLLIAAVLGTGWALRAVPWTEPAGTPFTVRLLQGNIPQNEKFEPIGVETSLELYGNMITAVPADLIITPETAFPIIAQQLPDELALKLRTFADSTDSALLIGMAGADSPVDFTNSVFGVVPGVGGVYRYDKHHLVPFGEFIPLGFRWFVDMMHMPLGDFRRGDAAQPPMEVRGLRIAPNICYEDLFGEEIALSLRRQAQPAHVLVNVTNLAWFGDTIALDQHLQISQMRALETGRPMLRATNTGATALIAADGTITARLPHVQRDTLTVEVQGMQGLTPYVRTGNAVVLCTALLILAGATWSTLRSARRNSRQIAKNR